MLPLTPTLSLQGEGEVHARMFSPHPALSLRERELTVPIFFLNSPVTPFTTPSQTPSRAKNGNSVNKGWQAAL